MTFLIFDLDGTLIDSKLDIVLCVNRAFQKLGLPALPEEKIGEEIGRGTEYLFRRLLLASTPLNLIHDLVICFKEIYQHHLLDHTQIYPGMIDALTHYKAFPKVIVTNKNQVFADQIVNSTGLRPYFEGVFGSEAFSTQKPDPGPLLEVCKKWNVPPSEAIIIGDSQFDMIAGKAAGVRTVGVLYGFGNLETFRLNPPDFQVKSARELIGLFPNCSSSLRILVPKSN